MFNETQQSVSLLLLSEAQCLVGKKTKKTNLPFFHSGIYERFFDALFRMLLLEVLCSCFACVHMYTSLTLLLRKATLPIKIQFFSLPGLRFCHFRKSKRNPKTKKMYNIDRYSNHPDSLFIHTTQCSHGYILKTLVIHSLTRR